MSKTQFDKDRDMIIEATDSINEILIQLTTIADKVGFIRTVRESLPSETERVISLLYVGNDDVLEDVFKYEDEETPKYNN